MQLLRRLRYGDRHTSRVRDHFSTPAVRRVPLSAIVLLVAPDRDVTVRLINSLSDISEGTLTVLCANSLSEATQRLDLNDSIDAVILDCDMPAARDCESLLVLVGAAPHLPIIVLGEDRSLLQQMNLVEHGAQDYLSKRRLNAETLVSIVYLAIARKYRNWTLLRDQAGAQTVPCLIGDPLLSADGSPIVS